MDEHGQYEGLWFDDDGPTRDRSRRKRTLWVVLATAACIGALSVPVAYAFTSHGGTAALPAVGKHAGHSNGNDAQAQRVVIAALSATTSSGSFNVSYEFDPSTAPTVLTTTTTTDCAVSPGEVGTAGEGGSPPVSGETTGSTMCSVSAHSMSTTTITGQGTIDTDPFAMVATSNVSGLGLVTLRDNGTDVWEQGGGDYGLAPNSTDTGPGSPLSGFASLVEGTLGQRQGALAMGGLSSPTGYLDLDQSMISGADQIGTGTVDGVPVTVYQLTISPAAEADVPRLTDQESEAITAASAVLAAQGYTGTTVQVSIDASGYIRQTVSTAHFSDGSTSVSEATFSDFGCAGTVLMPGQTGATAPPAGCVSPDTGLAPVTPNSATTSTTSTSATTSTPASSSTTSTPPASSTTSTTS
jgi:hypothetical protein